MMLKKTLILLTVTLYFKGYSQFIVTQQPSVVEYFSTLLPQSKNNQFQLLVLRDYYQTSATRKNHQIVKYDFNGQLLDSINLPKGFNPVSFPLKYSDYYYWTAVYYDTLVTPPNSQEAFVLKFDSLFNCIERKKLNALTNTIEIPSNIVEINNKLFVSVKNHINNNLELYCLDPQLNKRDSTSLIGNYDIVELRKTFDNQILIAGSGFPPTAPSGGTAQKIIMDTLLSINNVFNLDSLTYVTAGGSTVTGCSSQIGVEALYFKAIPVSSSKTFICGSYPVVYNSNCNDRNNLVHSIIDNNNQIIQTTLISDSTRGIKYADNINYVDVKGNYIYSVGSAGFNGGILQTNNSNILICKSDTMGNLIWKKEYGDDMFYRPISIIQTLDSGFLVSGLRYNYVAPAYSNIGENFILRLDKNGNFISTSIKEQVNKDYSYFKYYPNPSKDVFHIDVPLTKEYDIYIYDVYGQLVTSIKNYKNLTPISIEHLSSGAYVLKLKTNNNLLSNKLIKE